MKSYSNPLASKICTILTPLVGEIMACGVLKSQAEKLGVNEETLSQAHLPDLAEKIQRGLVIFVGSDIAAQVAQKIKDLN